MTFMKIPKHRLMSYILVFPKLLIESPIMNYYSSSGNLLALAQFFNNRTQCVCLNGLHSSFLPILSGVPQGNILGPLLFLVYDLFSVIYCCNSISFADDTKCYKLILQLLDSLQLQQDLDSLSDWSRHWNFFLILASSFIYLSTYMHLIT